MDTKRAKLESDRKWAQWDSFRWLYQEERVGSSREFLGSLIFFWRLDEYWQRYGAKSDVCAIYAEEIEPPLESRKA